MVKNEKIIVLNAIKEKQGNIGISRNELLEFLYHSPYNMELNIISALIEQLKQENFITVTPYGNDRYLLSASGILWLRDKEFEKNRQDLIKAASKAFPKDTLSTNRKWNKETIIFWCTIVGTIATVIGAVYLFI